VEGQQVEGQKIKLVKVDRVKEWKVEKILNKRKDDLENTRETVVEFKRRMSTKVR